MRTKSGRSARWAALAIAALIAGVLIAHEDEEEDRAALASAGAVIAQGHAGSGPARSKTPVAPGGESPASDGGFELRVVAGGAAQAGAEVRLVREGARDPNTGEIDWVDGGAATTGAGGVVRIDAAVGSYVAIARLAGHGPAFAQVARPQGEAWTRATLRLSVAQRLSGSVVMRATREPVPLAQLVATPLIGRSGEAWRDVPPQALERAQADARGQFVFTDLSAGAWRISAAAPGSGKGEAQTDLPQAAPISIELVASAYLEGQVLARDGSPGANAEVIARNRESSEQAETDAAGAFSLEVSPGAWRLSATRGLDAAALPGEVGVKEGETRRGLALHLAPGAAIAGRILLATGAGAVADARILVSPHDASGDCGRASSARDGNYSIEGLAPGSYDVVVERDGYGRAMLRGASLSSGQRLRADFALHGTGSIEGFVRDSDARPIEGATVERQANESQGSAQALSGADGAYRLDSIDPGRAIVVAKRPGALRGHERAIQVTENQTARADFTLRDSGRIAGRVSCDTGELVDDAFVAATPGGAGSRDGLSFQASARAKVASDGSYSLDLPAGRYEVRATVKNNRSDPAQLTASADAATTHDFVVDCASTSITLQIVDADGAPSPFANVIAEGRGVGLIGRADESGQYVVSIPATAADEPLEVRAWDGPRGGSASVPADETQATVTLQAPGSVSGAVSGDPPVRAFSLDAVPSGAVQTYGSHSPWQFVGSSFSLPEIAPGTYALRVDTGDGRWGEARVSVESGSAATVQIAVAPGNMPATAPGKIGIMLDPSSSSGGVLIVMVAPGSPAEQAGILVGDIVLAIDGQPVSTVADVMARGPGAPGSQVAFTLLRDGAVFTLQLVRES